MSDHDESSGKGNEVPGEPEVQDQQPEPASPSSSSPPPPPPNRPAENIRAKRLARLQQQSPSKRPDVTTVCLLCACVCVRACVCVCVCACVCACAVLPIALPSPASFRFLPSLPRDAYAFLLWLCIRTRSHQPRQRAQRRLHPAQATHSCPSLVTPTRVPTPGHLQTLGNSQAGHHWRVSRICRPSLLLHQLNSHHHVRQRVHRQQKHRQSCISLPTNFLQLC